MSPFIPILLVNLAQPHKTATYAPVLKEAEQSSIAEVFCSYNSEQKRYHRAWSSNSDTSASDIA